MFDEPTLIVDDLKLEMVPVRAGRFRRVTHEAGSGTSRIQTVTISRDFWIGRHPVTQTQYREIMHVNPSYFEDPAAPVENVSWLDAAEFCLRLSEWRQATSPFPVDTCFRLPTEAEWEYCCQAAPAGLSSAYPFGDDPKLLAEFAWYEANSRGSTHPAGEKKPNAWGLYDMLGNVGEWCLDWFAPYPPDDLTDPAGPETGQRRVRRGGSWASSARRCRTADRIGVRPECRCALLGLRVVLVPPPAIAPIPELRMW